MTRTEAIWDVDDALYASPSSQKRELATILVESSQVVVAGNRVLAGWAESSGAYDVRVIPTCVAVPALERQPDEERTRALRIGWLGSPATEDQLAILASPLRALVRDRGVELIVMGGRVPPLLRGQEGVHQVSWSAEGEDAFLRSIDVGIAPLRDGELERGKCGFKTLKYMSYGVIPCVTFNQVHSDIVGDCGILISEHAHWFDGLMSLLNDPDLRARLGHSARTRVKQHYSTEVGVDLWAAILLSDREQRH
ncbi:MAG: glycosyltransferase [Actinobacteria bacterium]|nr:glycosyltransferase [Actinomycetota bacterium]